MITTHRTRRPRPATPRPEPITIERAQHRSPWPMAIAFALAAMIGPALAWALLYADLAAVQQLGVAAGVPVGLGLLGAATGAVVDRWEARR
ncbi:MAG: hypothetical protein AAFN30_20560 [Actinomycetota bacterium]